MQMQRHVSGLRCSDPTAGLYDLSRVYHWCGMPELELIYTEFVFLRRFRRDPVAPLPVKHDLGDLNFFRCQNGFDVILPVNDADINAEMVFLVALPVSFTERGNDCNFGKVFNYYAHRLSHLILSNVFARI